MRSLAKIRVVVVDDSDLARELIGEILHSEKNIEVVGYAKNGKEGVALVKKLRPDIVTMDIHMPVMTGKEATQEIMAYTPVPILVVTASAFFKEDEHNAFNVISQGALDVIHKPTLGSDDEVLSPEARTLIAKVKLLAGCPVITHVKGRHQRRSSALTMQPKSASATVAERQPKSASATVAERQPKSTSATVAERQPRSTSATVAERQPKSASATVAERQPKSASATSELASASSTQTTHHQGMPLIGIASSTGGPKALRRVLEVLPPTLPTSVLIVQHIADGFVEGLVAWLDEVCPIKVVVARNGDKIQNGQVYIAPNGTHLTLSKTHHIALKATAPVSGFCPSGTELFFSLANFPGSIGVILTGMGKDGVEGLVRIRQKGGYVIAQDESSSAIYGMPRVAMETGVVHQQCPLDKIGPKLMKLLAQNSNA
ncbi:MAG: chemotaxis-specific protein-glutamate methyltransferase CheB [Planctomycetes bacterium]|nr:chemotaxis-specific protein-glutamate methyltransferase CheB [Planctomycetota bacterium]